MVKSLAGKTLLMPVRPVPPGAINPRVVARAIQRKTLVCQSLPDLSILETTSVSHSTLVDYLARVISLVWVMQNLGLDWDRPEGLDTVLVRYFDFLFMELHNGEDGSKILLAIKFFLPEYSRLGAFHLPRAIRFVKSLIAEKPSVLRPPPSLIALCAVLGYLIYIKDIATALQLLLQFRTYIRPGVFDALMVGQLVPPSHASRMPYCLWGVILYPSDLGQLGKTGTSDDAVLIDSETWLGPFLQLLTNSRDKNDLLWTQPGAAVNSKFKTAFAALNLTALKPVRYSLRHGGASDDLLNRRRSIEEVKKRGQWRTDSSLRRYGKETKALSQIHLMPPPVKEFGQKVAENLELVFNLHVILKPPMPNDCQTTKS